MDCMSAHTSVREVAMMFPIQDGKTEVALNVVGYVIDHAPGPVMVALPGEAAMNKWIAQKLGPMIDETPCIRRALTSTATRDGANRREFKDFVGGQLYIEHAGSPQRLKSATVKILIVDEVDEFASQLTSGDDPIAMLEGRTSAYPSSYKRLYISSPQIQGVSRIESVWLTSDMRLFNVECPHCGHAQPLEWSGLHWNENATDAWYGCRECGAVIEEHHKTALFEGGQWIPQHPERSRIRHGYHCNALYYPMGLGPRWRDLARMWIDAQNDPAKLKTFINDRLAEPWEDPAMRAVKHNLIADRAEDHPLRPVPDWVLAATAGVDTQDNRLAVQIIGWGRGMASWTIDYVELPGDPANDDVWVALTDLLSRPIERSGGGSIVVGASAIDMGGHRTEAVKAYVRGAHLRRVMAIHGAVQNNAPPLGKAKLQDVNFRGRYDKRGVHIYAVGTVAIKHMLYSRLSTDAEKQPSARLVRFSDQLDNAYFGGLTAETYNPAKNRFEKRRGAPRNEPLDTWVYAYAAAHHPQLRLHRHTKADWDALSAKKTPEQSPAAPRGIPPAPAAVPAVQHDIDDRAGGSSWGSRL